MSQTEPVTWEAAYRELLNARAILERLQKEREECQRVVAVLLKALGGSYTVTQKELIEMPLDVTISVESRIGGSRTIRVVEERL